jgi:hypothetical protein
MINLETDKVTFDSIIIGSHGFENCRKAETDLSVIESSLKKVGLLENLVIWEPDPGVHVLIAGHNRFKCIQNIKRTEPETFEAHWGDGIDARILKGGSLSTAMELSLSENTLRNKLNPADEAEYIALLRDRLEDEETATAEAESRDPIRITQKVLAKRIYGKEDYQGEISKKLRLYTNLCDPVFIALREDKITQKTAEQLAGLTLGNGEPDVASQTAYLDQLLGGSDEQITIEKKPRVKTYRTKREVDELIVAASQAEGIDPEELIYSITNFADWFRCEVDTDTFLYGSPEDVDRGYDLSEEGSEEVEETVVKRRIRAANE